MTEPELQSLRALLDDDTTSGELRSILEARSGHDPSAEDLAGLGKRLAAALPAGAMPAPASGGGGVLSSSLAKVAIVVALGGAVAVGVGLGRSPAPPETTPPVVTAIATPPAAASPPIVEASPEASVVSLPAPAPAPRPSTTTTTKVESVAPAPPEATLLSRAHNELLSGSPERALATTAEHARAYPRGALAQERDVIAIEALVKLGRRDEARRRAASFRQTFPGSSHGDRIDRLVGETP
jgi:hypothetical protein